MTTLRTALARLELARREGLARQLRSAAAHAREAAETFERLAQSYQNEPACPAREAVNRVMRGPEHVSKPIGRVLAGLKVEGD